MFCIRETFLYSDRNAREENQDRALSIHCSTAPPAENSMLILCVMDGVSRNNGGEAVRHAAPFLQGCLSDLVAAAPELLYCSDEELEAQIFDALCDAILETDRHLRAIGCTTVSIAVVFDGRIYAANVGDSPIYLIDLPDSPGEPSITELFRCHNAAGDPIWDDTRLSPQALAEYEAASSFLLRCAGSLSGLNKEDIHLISAKLRSNNLLLLGSDGALSVLCKKALLELAAGKASPYGGNALRPLTEALYGAVREKHGTDNFTLVGAMIQRD